MTEAQINKEIEKTSKLMDKFLACVKDVSLSKEEKENYYSEYLKVSTYFLKLNQVKPNHNLKIA